VLLEHGHVLTLVESPSSELVRWLYVGPDPRKEGQGASAPFLVFTQREAMWIKLVFGMSRAGSMNFISPYGATRERDINRWKLQWEHEGMLRRGEVDPSSAG
jgi:hypothetical protein